MVPEVFPAIARRWAETDLATRLPRVYGGEAVPEAQKPYAVIYPLVQAPLMDTNRGRYFDFTFEVHVVADNFDDASVLGQLVQDRLCRPSLAFQGTNNRLLDTYEGNMTWQEMDLYWQTVCEFLVRVSKPGGPS